MEKLAKTMNVENTSDATSVAELFHTIHHKKVKTSFGFNVD